jgi:hypothetical protein
MLHALPITFSLIWSLELCLAKSTRYEAPHYAVFSNLSSLHLSPDQICYLVYVRFHNFARSLFDSS